jgi:hypothetical protein
MVVLSKDGAPPYDAPGKVDSEKIEGVFNKSLSGAE